MDAPLPPVTKRAPIISGRVFVPLFVIALGIAVAVAVTLTLRVRPVAMSARAKTFPLAAKIEVYCQAPGMPEPADLHLAGRCSAAGTLVLGTSEPGEAARHVGYALVGETASEQPMVGTYEVGKETSLPLASQVAGPHTLVFFVAEKPIDLVEMKHALTLARPGDLGDTLLRLEQFRVVLRHQENDARIERLRFKVEG
jgi:hypothetical protein